MEREVAYRLRQLEKKIKTALCCNTGDSGGGSGTIDAVPTDGSSNAVSSNGVFDALAGKQNTLTNPVTGTGTATRIPFYTGTTTLGSSANIYWDNTNNQLVIGDEVPDQSIFKLQVGKTGVSGRVKFISNDDYNMLLQNGGGRVYVGSTVGSELVFSTLAGTMFGKVSPSLLQFATLVGTGTRMLVSDSSGIVTTQAIPSGGGTPATASELMNDSQVNFVGDSLIDLSPNWISPASYFRDLTGFKVNNQGATGTTTTQIKTKFDSLPTALLVQGWLIEGGRNDIAQGGYVIGVSNTIKSNIAAMVASITATGNNKYLVMGIVPSNTETTVSAGGIFVNQLNTDLATLYGTRFVDVAAALRAAGDGGTNDNADIAAGIMPRSKMYDTIHPNTAGNSIIAQAFAAKIAILAPNQDRVITIASLGGVLQQNQSSYSVNTGGAYYVGDYVGLRIPDQNSSALLNSIIVGSGAKNISHTTGSTGQGNTIVGMLAANSLTTGASNTLVGNYSGYNLVTGNSNTFMGESSGLATTGSDNVAIGNNAGRGNTSGGTNVYLGSGAGRGNLTGNQNIYVGFNSGFANSVGNNNVGLGISSLQNSNGGSANTALGTSALKGTTNAFSNNVGIGTDAGLVLTTGSNNILIGYKAAETLTSGSNNIIIGYDIDPPSNTASNQLSIGNIIFGTGVSGTGTTIAGSIGIGVNAPTSTLQIGGSFSSSYTTKSADYTATISDHKIYVDASAGVVNITLPTSVGIGGRDYIIKKIDTTSNAVNILTTSSQTIDLETSQSIITPLLAVTVSSNNANWFIL